VPGGDVNASQSFFCARSAAGEMGTFAEEVPGSDSGSATFSAGDEELAAAATGVQVVPVVTVVTVVTVE